MNARFVSLDDMISCARRELFMRRNAYPKWVTGGRMTQDKADKEILVMRAILNHLLKTAGRPEENYE